MNPVLRIGASGLILPSQPMIDTAQITQDGYNFRRFFRDVQHLSSNCDIAIAQLASPVSRDVNTVKGGVGTPPLYIAPLEVALTLQENGFTTTAIGGEHCLDARTSGLTESRVSLNSVELDVTGPNPDDPDNYGFLQRVNGVTIAQFSYSEELSPLRNNNDVDNDGSSSLQWQDNVLLCERGVNGVIADARAARKAGAEIVIITVWWGEEKELTRETGKMTTAAHDILNSGEVDWIIGASHNVLPSERVNGCYVSYGLGDFYAGSAVNGYGGSGTGMFTRMSFTRRAGGGFNKKLHYTPTMVNPYSLEVEMIHPIHQSEMFREAVNIQRGNDVFPVFT